ncbi:MULTISPECIES: hypothetical protein [Fischerella]|nr:MULTISPECIES: hypothetical protein [Fischerella]
MVVDKCRRTTADQNISRRQMAEGEAAPVLAVSGDGGLPNPKGRW